MQRYISFSGGVESRTMAILYGKGAKLIWNDTGAEHDALYDQIDEFERWIIEFHKGDCELIRLKGDYPVKGERVDNLWDAVRIGMFMPSGLARWCTGWFKIKPTDNFLKKQGECELLIGFNADEIFDRQGNYGLNKNVHYRYALADDGYTRDDCENILNIHGVHPKFPVYMRRGGCKFCYFKSEAEYKAMFYLNRKEFDEVEALENAVQDKRKKFFSILQSGKSMKQIRQECEAEMPFDFTEIYKRIDKQQRCGAFCNR